MLLTLIHINQFTMKVCFTFILMFCSNLLFSQNTYNSTNHYNFEIPAKWELIPKKQLNAQMKERQLDAANYEIGLQLKNDTNKKLHYPYLLVQYLPTNMDFDTVSFNRISFDLTRYLKKEISNYQSTEIDTNQLKLLHDNGIKIDSTKYSLTQTLTIRVSGNKQIIYTKQAFVGRFGVLLLNFYSIDTTSAKFTTDLKKISNSLSFEKNYQYIHQTSANRIVLSMWSKLAIALMVSIIVFLVIKYCKW